MSTISNERLEEIEDFGSDLLFESSVLARELLALRKERERAEPVAYRYRFRPTREAAGKWILVDTLEEANPLPKYEIQPLYTAPPAPVADDSLPFDPQIAEYEQMMEAEQAQAGTTSQQFESLAGKAVGRSDGFECTPVADLYELLTKCGECYDYTTSAKVAADWIKEGYSAREYVKLDRLQEAMTQGSSGEPDGWIPCSERMPPENTGVLVATEFDGPGDWRMKWGTRVPGHPDAKNGWFISGASWTPSHWQPLPEPPCK
ncbi:DUF551 domain-containing protein [Cronobacter sakazakii]|uniref:DUF551 domain-containing protein n=1 Tax=Cronobacter sakazakii TaxID=28141 RepID=UPI0018F89530|nr:DUF551 domain-containing protein [Cronobacter sakazakii]